MWHSYYKIYKFNYRYGSDHQMLEKSENFFFLNPTLIVLLRLKRQ